MGTEENSRLFAKDQKLHVIEYAVGSYQEMPWADIKHHVMEFNPLILFQKPAK